MNDQLSRENAVIFIAFTLSFTANSLALTLTLIQGYHPFSSTQLQCSNLSDDYFVMKYGDCANRAFLVMTISLCISEFFTIIGFVLSLRSFRNKGCTKNQCFVKNKFQSLYVIAAVGTIGLGIVSGWQTTILIELLLPNKATNAVNLASTISAYLGLALFILTLLLILKYNALRQQQLQDLKPQKVKRRDHGQSNIYQLKIGQLPKIKEFKPQQVKVLRKNIKSTKKKEQLIKNEFKQNQQLLLKEPFFEQLKHNFAYQTSPGQSQHEGSINLSSPDHDEHLEIVVNRPTSPKKMNVPKLALNMIAPKKKQPSAKRSLSKLDISVIFPIQSIKPELQLEEHNSDNASILGGIKGGKIPEEVKKSPRPDIKKIRQALKTQNISLTPKNDCPSKNVICVPKKGELSFENSSFEL